ncbi:MAG: STN and carboxypeptidase regulatory-like domain-containing protein [Bacteroidia bacterium]
MEREVTLTLNNERISEGLNKIQDQTGLIFSYSSSIINNLQPISINIKQKTVREVLALLLPNHISYRAKNNYIILKERSVEKNPKKTELSGYVYDKTTDKKIANVTIYDKTSLQSVTTDEYGYYSISIPIKNQSIIVNKENYRDTVLKLSDLKNNPITFINLDPVNDSLRDQDSVLWKKKLQDFSNYTNDLFKKFKGYVNTLNVKDTLSRNFQISLIPFVGTNGLLSGNIYNKYSVNIFGGYSRGTTLLEVGGFFNVDRENVKGAQIASFFNVVGDSVKGAQLTGFFNVTGKNMNGIQAAGFANVNLGKTKGVQLTGFLNFCKDSLKGVQAVGYVNYAKNVEGVQASGFINYSARTLKGVQVTGFVNHAKEVDGMQLAGFVNHAHKVNGFQVAVLNISDSCNGLPIGVLSFVKHGLHQVEFSGDELFYGNVSFRTGVNKFYNIVSIGTDLNSSNPLWTVGYGLGTSFKIKNKLRSDITLNSHHISKGNFALTTSEQYKLYWGLEYKFTKRFSVAAGPVFNLYLSDTYDKDYNSIYNKIAPYYMFNNTSSNGYNLKGWVGGKLALRFF